MSPWLIFENQKNTWLSPFSSRRVSSPRKESTTSIVMQSFGKEPRFIQFLPRCLKIIYFEKILYHNDLFNSFHDAFKLLSFFSIRSIKAQFRALAPFLHLKYECINVAVNVNVIYQCERCLTCNHIFVNILYYVIVNMICFMQKQKVASLVPSRS